MTDPHHRPLYQERRALAHRREVADLREELAATQAVADSLLEELRALDRHESRLLDALADRRAVRTPPPPAPDIGALLHEYRRRTR